MINFFKKPNEKIFNVRSLNADDLLYKVFPRLFMEILQKYFRLEIEGVENIPADGPVIIAPNHSGFTAMDAMVIAYILQKKTKRIPRVLTHHLWFLTKTTSLPAHKLGFFEATYDNGLQFLKNNQMIVLFPEGEHGNFKPSSKRYQLQEFKRGFVRLSLETKAQIVPTIVLGAEETHINLRKLKFTKFLHGLVLPLPLNVIPLPAKWKIIFKKPVLFPFDADRINDSELMRDLAFDIQEKMQKRINTEIKAGGFGFY
ncbi:MAG: lysophospholipid acyltransferase family protein [Pseudobdellovibrio sp.]